MTFRSGARSRISSGAVLRRQRCAPGTNGPPLPPGLKKIDGDAGYRQTVPRKCGFVPHHRGDPRSDRGCAYCGWSAVQHEKINISAGLPFHRQLYFPLAGKLPVRLDLQIPAGGAIHCHIQIRIVPEGVERHEDRSMPLGLRCGSEHQRKPALEGAAPATDTATATATDTATAAGTPQ